MASANNGSIPPPVAWAPVPSIQVPQNASNVAGTQASYQFIGAVQATNLTRSGYALPAEHVLEPTAQYRDLGNNYVEALGLTIRAPRDPCRVQAENGECILVKEIPLVYANAAETAVHLGPHQLITQTYMQRSSLDRNGTVGHVATSFCGDPAVQGFTNIFYTVGFARGRIACNASQLLPGAVLFGQFSSLRLNRTGWLVQSANNASYAAFELTLLYANTIDDCYRAGATSRRGFLGYMASYASAQYPTGDQRGLSLYAIQFPIGPGADSVDEDCTCTTGCTTTTDAETSTTNLLVSFIMEDFSFTATGGTLGTEGEVYRVDNSYVTAPCTV